MPCTVSSPCPVINVTSMSTYLTYPNTVTGGMFGIALVIVIFVICFVSLRAYPPRQSFPASMFITTVLTALLRIIGVVGDPVLLLMLIGTAIVAVLMTLPKD